VNLIPFAASPEPRTVFTSYTAQKSEAVKRRVGLQRAIQQIKTAKSSPPLRIDVRRGKRSLSLLGRFFPLPSPGVFGGGRADPPYTDPATFGDGIASWLSRAKLSNIGLIAEARSADRVSLIFAIFRSPFAVLIHSTKVDAPLDEANVSRYSDMVRSR